MIYAMIALLAGGLLFLAGCRSNGEMSRRMLDELARSNAEIVTLTTIAGSLGTVLAVLAACLAFAIYRKRREGGNGE